MEEKAIRGVPWTFLSYAGNRVLLLLTTVALARLLSPKDFGVVALAVLAVGALTIFADVGLGSVLIVRQDLDRQGEGVVLTIMLVLSAAFALVIVATAPLAADLFDTQGLTAVLRVMGLSQLYGGLNWFYDTLLQRELEFRRRFVARTVQSCLYGGVSIALAAAGAGVWSLVAGLIAGDIAFTVLAMALAPRRVRPGFDRAVAGELARDGRGFMVQSAVSFLKYNIDYIAVGRIAGATQVGFYSMAYRLGEQTYWAIADPLAKVTFPAFARMRDRGEEVAPAFLSALRWVALAAFPAGLLMSAAAEPFTRVVFGDKWLPMVGPLAVLGLWAAVRPLHSTIEWLLNSLGRAGPLGAISTALFVPQVAGVFLAAELGGITAVAWVMLAHAVASVAVLVAYTARAGEVAAGRMLQALRPLLLAGVVTWLVARVVASSVSAPGAALAAAVAAGLVAYGATIWVADRRLLGSALHQARRALGRAAAAPAGR